MSDAEPKEVLVVDDSVTERTMVGVHLERAGYRVRLVASGDRAIWEALERPPDLLVCDIEMPEMDGYEVVSRLRENPLTERIPVILLSSRDQMSDKIRGLDTGATDYVTKPYRMEELVARIRTHLRVKALQDEVLVRNAELAGAQSLLRDKMQALEVAYQRIAEDSRRMKQAVDLASRVQRGLLPARPPVMEGYTVWHHFRPAEGVAGDFYDYIDLGDGLWGLCVGDVAGKGVAASLVMVLVRTVVRATARQTRDPAEVLNRVNQLVIREYGTCEATTLFYGLLDTLRGTLTYSSAGHEFPVLVGATGTAVELTTGGPLLGVFHQATYNQASLGLLPGDWLVLFTDGLYCLDWEGRPIEGGDRLQEIMGSTPRSEMDQLWTRIAGPAAADDITVVRLLCESSPVARRFARMELRRSAGSTRELRGFVQSAAWLAGVDQRTIATILGRAHGGTRIALEFRPEGVELVVDDRPAEIIPSE